MDRKYRFNTKIRGAILIYLLRKIYNDNLISTRLFYVNCAAGKDNSRVPGSECDNCTAGKYSSNPGDTCNNCSVGTYSTNDGSPTCTICSGNKQIQELNSGNV